MSHPTADVKAQMANTNPIDDDAVFTPAPGPYVLPAPGMRQDGLPEPKPWAAVAPPPPPPPAFSPYVIDHAPYPPPRGLNKMWTDEVKRIVLESMCRYIDADLRPKHRFSNRAYLITIAEIAREAEVEITTEEIESLMQAQRRNQIK
ncbi:hypothetical protein B0T24DRAFT_599320 [Lasiosphaeria ovina]|uniref:Uncharacterized protein n=1 Tax=Lasiosphaeria ovina TaxID=92902 RepID=A0AAE0MZ17_9PEZI|nr:hypothetical protein B0T24DRAFT_599320 [Lasiosphaeria ovina]